MCEYKKPKNGIKVKKLEIQFTKHDQRDELTGVGLGGGDTDLGSGVDMNTAVRLTRDRTAHRVRDAHNERTALLAVPQREDRVGGLARLRDEKAHVVAKDGRVSVQKVAGQLDHDGQFGELFEELTCSDRAVVASAARDKHEPPAAPYLGQVVLDAAQSHFELIVRDSASHGVHHGLGLLEDLLLHKVLVVALHDLLDLHGELLDLAMRRLVYVAPFHAVYGQAAVAHHRHVVVLEEDHLVGVLDHGRGVRGEKVLDLLVRADRVVLGLVVVRGSSHWRLHHWIAEFYVFTKKSTVKHSNK